MDGWGKWMDGVNGWMDGWMDGWVDRWMDGWMDGWIGVWVDRCVGVWMDGWMDDSCFFPLADFLNLSFSFLFVFTPHMCI